MVHASILELALAIMFSTMIWLAIGHFFGRKSAKAPALDYDKFSVIWAEGVVSGFCARVQKKHNVNLRMEDFKAQYSPEEFVKFAEQVQAARAAKQIDALVKKTADDNRAAFGPVK